MSHGMHRITVIAFTYEPYDCYYSIINMSDNVYKPFEECVTKMTQLIKNQTDTFFGQILGVVVTDEETHRQKYIGCMFWGNNDELITVGNTTVYSKIYVSLIENDPCTDVLMKLNVAGTYTIETNERNQYWYNKA